MHLKDLSSCSAGLRLSPHPISSFECLLRRRAEDSTRPLPSCGTVTRQVRSGDDLCFRPVESKAFTSHLRPNPQWLRQSRGCQMNNQKMNGEQIECCPFCDSWIARTCEIDVNKWAVVCGKCEAIGPIAKSEGGAVEKWALRPWKPV